MFLPPHAHLREPLAHHIEVVLVTGALDHFRQNVVKHKTEFYRRSRRDGLWQRHLNHGPVFRVVVIRMDELHFVGQVHSIRIQLLTLIAP